MFSYNGFHVWFDELQGWHVQNGYEIIGTYKTAGGAKSAITQKWSKDDA